MFKYIAPDGRPMRMTKPNIGKQQKTQRRPFKFGADYTLIGSYLFFYGYKSSILSFYLIESLRSKNSSHKFFTIYKLTDNDARIFLEKNNWKCKKIDINTKNDIEKIMQIQERTRLLYAIRKSKIIHKDFVVCDVYEENINDKK